MKSKMVSGKIQRAKTQVWVLLSSSLSWGSPKANCYGPLDITLPHLSAPSDIRDLSDPLGPQHCQLGALRKQNLETLRFLMANWHKYWFALAKVQSVNVLFQIPPKSEPEKTKMITQWIILISNTHWTQYICQTQHWAPDLTQLI